MVKEMNSKRQQQLCMSRVPLRLQRQKPLGNTQLAGIDRGTQFPSDSAISPYGQVLDSLRGKCTNSRAELGDMSVGTQEMLADMGDPNSLLDILKMVDSVASTDLVMDCTDIFVILVVG
jgi:hypothetical protein